jgi:hypothetical protein
LTTALRPTALVLPNHCALLPRQCHAVRLRERLLQLALHRAQSGDLLKRRIHRRDIDHAHRAVLVQRRLAGPPCAHLQRQAALQSHATHGKRRVLHPLRLRDEIQAVLDDIHLLALRHVAVVAE